MLRMHAALRFATLAASALLCVAGSSAETATLTAGTRKAVIDAAADALNKRYVHLDGAARAAESIRTALNAGAYDQITVPAAFAERLTSDLRGAAGDRHLRVNAGQASPGPAGSIPRPPSGPPWPPRNEGGVVRADRLPGNVGYIEVLGFPRLGVFRAPLDRAMGPLEDTRALIIDLRRNGGGMASSEVYLASYLLDPDASVVVSRIVWRQLPGRKFFTEDFRNSRTPFHYAGKPVYVLTSGHTFSAGEALAYELQALKRVKVVGEITGGGANPGGTVLLGNGFSLFVPTGRNENPITRTSWEGVGVQPDIATPAPDALKAALMDLGLPAENTSVEALSEARLFQPDPEPAFRRMLAELRDEAAQIPRTNMRQQLPPLQRLLRPMGSLQSFRHVGIHSEGADLFDVQFAKGNVSFWIRLDPDGNAEIEQLQMPGR